MSNPRFSTRIMLIRTAFSAMEHDGALDYQGVCVCVNPSEHDVRLRLLVMI